MKTANASAPLVILTTVKIDDRINVLYIYNHTGVYCDAEVLDDTLWDTVKFNSSVVLLCPFTTSKF